MNRLLSAAQACVTTLLITCVSVATAQVPTELDWDTNAWPGGSLSETFTVGPGDVQISWSGDTGALIQGRPVTAQVETGGLIPAEDSLSIRVNYSDTSTQEIGATIDFTHPGGVTDASFTIFDIDAGANPWIDQIQVTATDGVSTFNPSSVTVVDPAYVNFDGTNTVTGLQSADSTSPLGNASFTFNQPGITQINLVYRDPPGALPNPGNQFVAIHDINFTYEASGPNLALTKTDSADPVSVGGTFTYNLTVTNNGPGDATNVTLIDTLPAGVDWQSATPSQGLCVHSGEPLGGTVTCTLGTIANGANATVDIEVVAPGTTGVISNSATVSADEPDPDASDNTATEETTIVNPPGSPVCQVDPSGTYIEAENFTGTIVQGATFAVESTTPGFNGSGYLRSTGGSTSSPPVHEGKIYNIEFITSGTYNVWMRGYALDGGSDSAFIGLNGTAAGALNEGGTYNTWVWSNGIQTGSNQITVPAAGFQDFNTWVREANHRIDGFYLTQGAETPTGGIPPGTPTLNPTQCTGANLALTNTDSSDPVSLGSAFTYNLTATNNGPIDATNVTLVDTLPADVGWQSVTPSQGSCVHSGEPLGGTVTCTLGTIANGANTTVDIEVLAPGTAGVISNSATVSADEPDPDASDNTAIEETIIGGADLSLGNSDSPDPVLVNQALSYSLIVDNRGPDDATDVVLVNTLPATVTFQSAISSQGICSEADGTVTCNFGTIANAANATVDIIVLAPASAGSITNNAVVSTSATDWDSANNNASETTTVQNLNVNQLCYLVADAGGGGGGNDLLTRIDTADFDPLTNETNIGIGTGTNTIEAIAWNSATGVLYAANADRLGTLSTTTGVFTALPSSFGTGSGALGDITFNDVDGLTYDATTSTLYGSERQSGADVLIQINMATGAHIPNAFGAGVDYVPMPPISGNSLTDDIAVDPTTGIMYAAVNSGGSTDRLIRVNKATGATTDVALITVPDIEGLGTDPTGQLWGTSGTQGILYELDKVTGIGSNGRPINNGSDYESVDCYAFSPSVIADLAVTKIVDDAAPAEGASATYTVTAINTGPGIATVVQLSDVLPSGVTFASAIVSQGTYNSTTGEWFVGTLGAGSNATLNLQASVDIGSSGSTITNTASVTFVSQNDPNASNDVASADIVPIALPASLLVLKSVSTVRDPLGATAPAALAIPGAVVQYEVSVTNSGGGAATETIITDTLNSNLTFLAGEFDGGAADIEIIVGAAAPVYCIAEVGGDTNTDGCFLSAGGDDLTVTIPVSASYPNGLTVGTTAPDNVVVVHFRATVN